MLIIKSNKNVQSSLKKFSLKLLKLSMKKQFSGKELQTGAIRLIKYVLKTKQVFYYER